jgi:hypothetical protein
MPPSKAEAVAEPVAEEKKLGNVTILNFVNSSIRLIIDNTEYIIKNTNTVSINEKGEADGYENSTCKIDFSTADTIEFACHFEPENAGTVTVKNIHNNTGNYKLYTNQNYTFVIFEGADLNEANGDIAKIASITAFNALSDNIINMGRPLFLAIFKNPNKEPQTDGTYRKYLGILPVIRSADYITTQFLKLITLNPTVTIYNMYNNDITLDINGNSCNILNTNKISSRIDNCKPNFYIKSDTDTLLEFDYNNSSIANTITGLDNTKKYVCVIFSGSTISLSTNNITNIMVTVNVTAISEKIGDVDIKSGAQKLWLAVFGVHDKVYDENAYNTFLFSSPNQKTSNTLLNKLVQLVPLNAYNVTIYNQYQDNMIFNINDISYTIPDRSRNYIDLQTCKFEYTTTNATAPRANKAYANTITGLDKTKKYVFLIIAASTTYLDRTGHLFGDNSDTVFLKLVDPSYFLKNVIGNDDDMIEGVGNLFVIIFSRSILAENDYVTFFRSPSFSRVPSTEMLASLIKIVKLT